MIFKFCENQTSNEIWSDAGMHSDNKLQINLAFPAAGLMEWKHSIYMCTVRYTLREMHGWTIISQKADPYTLIE